MLAPRYGRSKIQTLLAISPCKLSLGVRPDTKAAAWSQAASRQHRHCDCARPFSSGSRTFCLLQLVSQQGARLTRPGSVPQLYAGKRPIWKGMRGLYESLCRLCLSLRQEPRRAHQFRSGSRVDRPGPDRGKIASWQNCDFAGDLGADAGVGISQEALDREPAALEARPQPHDVMKYRCRSERVQTARRTLNQIAYC
jgi:hypothetical protein